MEQINYLFMYLIGPVMILCLIVLKIYYRFYKNKELHAGSLLKGRCPYCHKEVKTNDKFCMSCDRQIGAINKKELFCDNCGKINDISYYITYWEFWITFSLLGLIGIFPGIIYVFSHYDKKICKKCNRFL